MSEREAGTGSGSDAGARLPLPPVVLRGDAAARLAAAGLGALFGALTLVVPVLLPVEAEPGFFAVLLGVIPAIYVGFALVDGRLPVLGIEFAGLLAFGGLAVAALALDAPLLLVAGYVAHAGWDVFHTPGGGAVRMPAWYGPLCLGYDLVVALYVAVVLV